MRGYSLDAETCQRIEKACIVRSECSFRPGDGGFRHGSIAKPAERNVDVPASRGKAVKVLVDRKRRSRHLH
jgi:hypothetical protein